MRIYFAARYGRAAELREYVPDLHRLGHSVTSRWIDGDHDLPADAPLELGKSLAAEDLVDLHGSECLIAFTEAPGPVPGRARGGRHVEFGIALARRPHMRVVVCGPAENVFHCLDQVERFATWSELLAAFR